MIDFRLKTFIDLCETKSYTKTAKRLCITQPAVSQHIKYIESKYNIKLFDYIGKNLTLTKLGQDFLNNILKLKTMSLSIENNLKNSKCISKSLSFGATRSIGEFVMPNIIKNYLKDCPNANLSMVVDNTKTLLDMLKKGVLEFCFIEGHFNKADYETHLFSYEDFIFIASPKNHLAKKSNLSIEDLFGENLILREQGSGSRDIFELWLYEQNYSNKNFNSLLQVGNINLIKDLVKNNFGISIIYKVAVMDELEKNELIMLDINSMKLSHEFNFIYLKDSIFASEYVDFFNKINNF
ncbi:MAG: LysR family transcriptional regulator [Paraclostridium sordellii]|uniref:Transcriptional regulator LysR family n=1 Tax=Paraclostridium sordellii TaxID=1505 RepID=A0A9P1P9M5_PARSO|nr:LysR family transcriptional regulator [Paeniclostridium sordellii]EPZ56888.1 bacterial regulatory helix-turn-helix, lysR family protein [[Clostridium] sordellii VPI 9048] [Paeniclostridium sordellii VPI 9048]MCH1966703.1 LysR family transcriptional regulator [Paeniclostridium sordellii]CEK38606.1 LysR-family transcriptional regulator [[Clostridium] sordellii] [Paeniclostridium sordellii]CEN82142.1 transcriptional regulator LysR family [[Clostridium] sordellii] [Paeniclostridium sordellii]CE